MLHEEVRCWSLSSHRISIKEILIFPAQPSHADKRALYIEAVRIKNSNRIRNTTSILHIVESSAGGLSFSTPGFVGEIISLSLSRRVDFLRNAIHKNAN